jgi:DNA-directed RNA polymerase subunit RPC12/RpoP
VDVNTFISKIRAYFDAKGKYPDAVILKITQIVDRLTNEARVSLFDRLTEDNSPRFMVGVKELVEACKALGLGYGKTHYVPTSDYYCDACGEKFHYAQCVSDDDRIDKDIHDVCPTCGFQPGWTYLILEYRKQGNLSPKLAEWYEDQKKASLDKHSKTAPYFSRAKAESERREGTKKVIPTFKAKEAI